MVSAAIAAFFYLRVILLMYSPATPSAATPGAADPALAASAELSGPGAGSDAGAEAAGTLTLVEASDDPSQAPVSATTVAAIALCLAVTVVFGLWPAPVVDFAHKATLLFR